MSDTLPRSLYTWVDVQLALEETRARESWPEWLLGVSVYFDSILIRVTKRTENSDVQGFLRDVYGARFKPETQTIILEGAPDQIRSLAVEIEYSEEGESRRVPTAVEPLFRRIAAFPSGRAEVALPDAFPHGSPDIVAFYSFKGGVGRTTHLLGLLQSLSSSAEPIRALVIDADLEAPGITSLVNADKSFRPAGFSFADLLALAQSDTSEDFADTLRVATYAIQRQTLDLSSSGASVAHYVLPAFRSVAQAIRLEVRPEHLVARPGKAWALSALIADLGKRLDVSVVLIDLRAGFSELASPFLLDPRLHRVIVTTPSRQSLDGTDAVLKQLAKMAPPSDRKGLRDPTVVMSFVLPELVGSAVINDAIEELLGTYPEDNTDVDLPRLQVEVTTFGQEFLYLPSLSEALRRLSSSSMCRVMGRIATELAARQLPAPEGALTPNLEEIRSSLSELARKLEYAESGEGNQFLRTGPLRALVQQFTGSLPIAVVMGSKGAGKTYTYLQVVRSGRWSKFVHQTRRADEGNDGGFIWPLLESKNLKSSAADAVRRCRRMASAALGIAETPGITTVRDLINESLHHPAADETWWRHRWFAIFARSLGVEFAAENEAASRIIGMLQSRRQRLVLLVDGLEDLFPELEKDQAQRTALRVLLQDVPYYLREVHDAPIGVLIFVRGDLARAAISQNFGQFSHLYEAFELRWNEVEALRLAVWLADSAGLKADGNALETMMIDEAKRFLIRLWGRKLGPDDSREARSAEWVIAALSDFLGQIQARDLVRFLRHAAERSRNTAVTDRVLAPRAIRDAIEPCSREKIDEIKQEIPRLESIFANLQRSTNLRIPFDAASSGLAIDDIHFLVGVGALVEDKGEYFMPEIFRHGLGFQLAEGKRPRVLGLARRRVVT